MKQSKAEAGSEKIGTAEEGVKEPALIWVKRLRARYPVHAGRFTDAELEEMVRAALNACPLLHITETRDVFRLIALRVLITQEQKQSKLIEGALLRILCNLSWNPKKRLDFVYKHIINRPVSTEEPDFGPTFIPKRVPER